MSWNSFRAQAWRAHRRYRLLRVYKNHLVTRAGWAWNAVPAPRGPSPATASFVLGVVAAGATLWALSHRQHLPGAPVPLALEVNVPAPLPVADPAAANQLVEKAEALAAKGGQQAWKTAATDYLRPAVAADPRNRRTRALLALAYIQLADILPRDERFLKTVTALLDPRGRPTEIPLEAAAARAEWYRLMQRPDQAEEVLQAALAKRESPYLALAMRNLKADEERARLQVAVSAPLPARGPAADRLREAREFAAGNVLEKAKDKYILAIEADRLDPVPVYELGLLHLRMNEEAEGIYRLQKALELPGAPFDAAITLSRHLSTRYELTRALPALDWAKRNAGDDQNRLARLDYALGIHALRDRRPQEAEEHFRRGLGRAAGFMELYLQAAQLEMEKNKMELAEFYYAMALREAPVHPKAVLGLALARFHVDAPSRAVAFLKAKLALQPLSAPLMTNLAIIYLRSGDQLAGKNYLQNAIRADSHYAYAFLLLGDLTKDEGNRQSDYAGKRHSYRYALASYEMYSKLAPFDPEGYKLTADLYFDIRDLGASAKNYYKVLELAPNYPEIRFRLAQISRNGGDGRRAEQLLEEETKVNPRGDSAYVERGNINMAKKDFRQATQAYTTAIQLNEHNSDAFFGLGVIHHLNGAYDNALAMFNKVIKLDPLKQEVYWQMGLIYQKQSNTVKAMQAFTNYKAIAREPAAMAKADEKMREIAGRSERAYAWRSYASVPEQPEAEPVSIFQMQNEGMHTYFKRGSNLVEGGMASGPGPAFRTFANQFIEFRIPESWACALVGTNWACQDTDEQRKRDGVVLVTAKIKKPGMDEIPVYKAHFEKPNRYQWYTGETITSEPKYVRELDISGHPWVESVHFQSELPDYYTRYFATVEADLGIVVAVNVRKDRWEQSLTAMNELRGSLAAFRKPGSVNERPESALVEVAAPAEAAPAPMTAKTFEMLAPADRQKVEADYSALLAAHEKREFTQMLDATRRILSLVDDYRDTRIYELTAEHGLAKLAEDNRRKEQERNQAELRRSVSALVETGARLSRCATVRPELAAQLKEVGTLLLEKDPGNRAPGAWADEQQHARTAMVRKKGSRAPASAAAACRDVFYGPERKRAAR